MPLSVSNWQIDVEFKVSSATHDMIISSPSEVWVRVELTYWMDGIGRWEGA